MLLKTLQILCDVIETSSFGEAAKRHGMTQSAVSQRVKSLENELGVHLMERTCQRVAPTPEGRIVARAACAVSLRIRRMEAELHACCHEPEGSLRIAAAPGLATHGLAEVFADFRARHPGVTLEVTELRPARVCSAVLAGHADAGVIAGPVTARGLRLEVFGREEMCLVCPPSHALAGRRRLYLTDLNDQTLLTAACDPQARQDLAKRLEDLGVRPAGIQALSTWETVKRAVLAGRGVSLMPRAVAAAESADGRLCSVTVHGTDLSRPLGVILRRAKGPGGGAVTALTATLHCWGHEKGPGAGGEYKPSV